MFGRGCAAAALAVVAVAGAGVAEAQAARLDVSVARGSVDVRDGRVVGSFVVRDRGPAAGRVGVKLNVGSVVVGRYAVQLSSGASRTVRVSVAVPSGLPAGRSSVRVCADPAGRLREVSTANNCRTLGSVTTAGAPVPPAPVTAPSSGATPDPSPAPVPPAVPVVSTPSAGSGGGGASSGGGGGEAVVEPPTTGSSVPTAPIAYTANRSFALSTYWIQVPSAYDRTHATPTQLLVWLHGCGGYGRWDIDNVAPASTDPYIAISVGGREGDCWDVGADQAKVLAAIADVETHFNIDKRRIVLAGYSSGGDLTYRTAFYHARVFSGVLVENSTPFRDTGSSSSASIAAAAWKFPVVQLAHTGDTTYPIAQVRSETTTLRNAGFPVTLVERPGTHYDNPSSGVPGTDADARTYLLPHLGDGWLAPS
jgi:hypothetical protein